MLLVDFNVKGQVDTKRTDQHVGCDDKLVLDIVYEVLGDQWGGDVATTVCQI